MSRSFNSVGEAAAFLDEVEPQWWQRIDLETFSQDNGETCGKASDCYRCRTDS